jgi:hypothetical protein
VSAFEKQLRYGQQGEKVVARWLNGMGWFLTPTASIIDPSVRAPSLVRYRSGDRVVLPDFMASISGKSRWIETKTKSTDVYFNLAGEHRQGIESRLFDDYVFVQQETGIPGFIAFLVADKMVLRIGEIDVMKLYRRRGLKGNEHMVYWPIDIFETHEILDNDLRLLVPAPQKPNVSHAWDRSAPAIPDQQEYFNFPQEHRNRIA